MARTTIHAAIQDDLVEWVTRREALRGEARTLGRAAISELRTFKDLLDAELARTRWSLAELEVLARSTMGTSPRPATASSPGAMFGAVHEARRLGDVPDDETTAVLLGKLADLGPTADMALEYAAAAWWADHHEHTALDWESVGVRVITD
ncbi:hypothetical protein [Cutibacterium avidum]|uniref:Uncharacterized protein n=1 Tax=Cutibacterium avidum ATCC 25577 TaxID=997355 RepID=G4CYC3_9ACTN|nr:hypothetical protein [Cutibacterium avidum]EGY77987.1 hypothetical protein HMPREF9153_1530 [Cutibacterium avidum ATCC 25577]QRH10495.1 hypothetical protein JMX58_02375 [Cutibacterium avidum]